MLRRRIGGLARALDVAESSLSIRADFAFWELTNGPTIALREMLPPERYSGFARDAAELMAPSELTSSYLVVLATKSG